MIKELKKELSALSGVDFFNPKYREVFKRYFPNDTEEVAEEVAEEKVEEMVEEPVVETAEEVVEEKAEETIEPEVVEEVTEETNEEPTETTEEVAEEVAEDIEVAEDKAEEKIDDHKELIDAKVELELVKAGVRADRLDSAKKLMLLEINSLEDVEKVAELVKQYPEWLKTEKPVAKPLGMVLDNSVDGLTEEQKRLREMGIDPR